MSHPEESGDINSMNYQMNRSKMKTKSGYRHLKKSVCYLDRTTTELFIQIGAEDC